MTKDALTATPQKASTNGRSSAVWLRLASFCLFLIVVWTASRANFNELRIVVALLTIGLARACVEFLKVVMTHKEIITTLEVQVRLLSEANQKLKEALNTCGERLSALEAEASTIGDLEQRVENLEISAD